LNGDKYILVGQTAVPCDDLLEWGAWLETADRTVGRTVVGPYEVSTVFLGLDHNHVYLIMSEMYPDRKLDTRPVLFETMVFDATRSPRVEGETLEEWFARERRLTAERGLSEEILESQRRWHDWVDAEKGHEKVVEWVEGLVGVSRTEVEGLAHLLRSERE
jgi:hypothetical protein